MNPEATTTRVSPWQDFLRDQGAVLEAGAVRDFGEAGTHRRAARERDVLVDLSHFSLIRATGADVVTFLNGQLTCDVREITPERSRLGAWCSPKGRMLALFRLLRVQDGYLMQLPASLTADLVKRLRMYVLRSKVTLQPTDEALVCFGIVGPRAPDLIRDALGAAPPAENAVTTVAETLVCAIPGSHPRFQILTPPTRAVELWTRLKAQALPVGASAWTWHDIAAGIPIVLPETSDAFIPQMANLELLGGVSFTKGCYTGQEIVARVHYRGRLKQRMYRFHTETEETPAPGEPIYAPGAEQSSGTVVAAAPAPDGGQDLLAVVYCDRADAELHLGRHDGPRLRRAELPYPISMPDGD